MTSVPPYQHLVNNVFRGNFQISVSNDRLDIIRKYLEEIYLSGAIQESTRSVSSHKGYWFKGECGGTDQQNIPIE